MNNDFEEAKKDLSYIFKVIIKTIPDYDYSDKTRATATDEKVCAFLVEQLRLAKNKLFNTIETLYELQLEKPINRELEDLRDEVDIFSDEVKARYCEWKEISKPWMKKLIRHDILLIGGLKKLNISLDKFYKKTMTGLKKKEGKKMPAEFLTKLEGDMKKIEKQIDNLVVLFKEREFICNIKPISLEKTFQKVRKEIRQTV